MKIAAVCCTYLRPKHLGWLIKCFLEQDYADRELLILDDAGQYDSQEGDRWRLIDLPAADSAGFFFTVADRRPIGDAAHVGGSAVTQKLVQQLEDLESGIPPSTAVVLKNVPRPQRRRLLQGLKSLDQILRGISGMHAP